MQPAYGWYSGKLCHLHFNSLNNLFQRLTFEQIIFECFLPERYILQQVSEQMNRKCHPGNTTVQLSTLYTNPQHRNAQRHRQVDKQTDRHSMTPTAVDNWLI